MEIKKHAPFKLQAKHQNGANIVAYPSSHDEAKEIARGWVRLGYTDILFLYLNTGTKKYLPVKR